MPERYTIIKHYENRMWFQGSPVLFEAGNLLRDSVTGKMLFQAKFSNVTSKIITAFIVNITCVDVTGKTIGELEGFQYLDLSVGGGQPFGDKMPVILPYDNTRNIEVTAVQAVFGSGEMWENSAKAAFQPLPAQENLREFLSNDLYKQFERECKKQGSYRGGVPGFVPDEHSDYWLCACGQLNLAENALCVSNICRYPKNFILKTANPKTLEILLEEYNAQQEESRKNEIYAEAVKMQMREDYQSAAELFASIAGYKDADARATACEQLAEQRIIERERAAESARKRIKKILAVGLPAICVTGLFVILLNAVIIPSIKYSRANGMFEKNQYAQAEEAFKELGDYKDSAVRVTESIYLNAGVLFDGKQYEQAESVFSSLGDYKDSKDKANESRYLHASVLFAGKQYEQAASVYSSLGDYKDSKDKANESRYLHAGVLFAGKQYEQAASVYSSLGDYKDSKDKEKESTYLYAGALVTEKQYEQAAFKYSGLGKYKDSKSKCNSAKYNYVIINKSRSDFTTMVFLEDLSSIGYKDSKAIYNQLTKWVAKVIVNDSTDDKETDMNSIASYSDIVFHLTLSGGKPGESIKIKIKIIYPDGDTHNRTTDFTVSDGGGMYWGWFDEYSYYGNPTGKLTMKFYNAQTGDFLGSDSVIVY